jgi:lysozyme
MGCTVGIDVSKWQADIDWGQVASAGVKFAFIRAAYGNKLDKCFERNWQEARDAGIMCGAYQFVLGDKDFDDQATFMCETMDNVGHRANDLPLVIDVEDEDNEIRLRDVLLWCEIVQDCTSHVPIVYCPPYYWEDITTHPVSYPLWVSHIQTGQPKVPTSWPTWLFWQMSWAGSVDGIRGPVDINVFDGSFDQLKGIAHVLATPDAYHGVKDTE